MFLLWKHPSSLTPSFLLSSLVASSVFPWCLCIFLPFNWGQRAEGSWKGSGVLLPAEIKLCSWEGSLSPWRVKERKKESCSLVSGFLRPHGLQPTRLFHPWIFQARILEWVAISFSRGSSWWRDQTRFSCLIGRCFTVWATREAQPWRVAFCYEKVSGRISQCLLFTLPLLSIRNLFLTLFYLTGFLKVKHSSVGLPSNFSFKAILILILVYTQPLAINQNHHLCVPSSLWFHSLLLWVSRSELWLSGCTFSLV